MSDNYYRRGFGLKKEIAEDLSAYHSGLVDAIRASEYTFEAGHLTFRLAKEFGFCYGVDRAVEYAYETRTKFPDKKIHLVGEIIHNPHVNRRLEELGIEFIFPGDDGEFDFGSVAPEDVVLIPAFGVSVGDFNVLRDSGCILVDTTCGSVLNVWKRVQQYSRDGFTALVHGKHWHEETKATASQVMKHDGGTFLVVRNMEEAELVCRYIETADNSDELLERLSPGYSPWFKPEEHLQQVGVANQTTMLANESLAIAARVRESMAKRYGAESLGDHFRSFDTICSATQERQDAVIELIDEPLDAMIVIGGYNSSNTNHLAKICSERVTTFHINDAQCIDTEREIISHKPVGSDSEATVENWLDGVSRVGITAGASTPNNKIGEAIERVLRVRGIEAPSLDPVEA